MFKKASDPPARTQRPRKLASELTVLAEGSALEGSIRTRGPLQIDGAVCGSLTCQAPMSVGATGQIMGELRAESLSVSGRVHGLVFVRHHLQLRERGLLAGHARYETLEIARGGVVDGTTQSVSPDPTLIIDDEEDEEDEEDEYAAAE